MVPSSCPSELDNSWGPGVDSCRRAFDFTLIFEQAILSTLPACLFIFLASFRIWRILGRERRARANAAAFTKQAVIVTTFALQLGLVVLWSLDSVDRTRLSVPMAAVHVLAILLMAPLSWLEHTKTIKPSPLITSYLLLSTVLDMAQVRTLWIMNVDRRISAICSTLFAVRALLLALECLRKRLISEIDLSRSPEDKCDVISRSLFLWVVPLMHAGYRGVLGVADLYPPPIDASPAPLEEKLQRAWLESTPRAKNRLLFVTARALLPRLLSPIIPRLCKVGFMVAQPVLLLRLIRFLDDRPLSPNDGYGLLGAYALVYLGVAVTNAWFFHQNFKFLTAVRAGLVALVYDKTMRLSTSAIDKSSAVTVMSADIERIVIGLKTIHDVWANIIQVALAAWLLGQMTGVAVVLPLVVAAACGYGTLKISVAAGGQQIHWLQKIEKRIEVTTHTLSSMRGVKMSGLAPKLSGVIQSMRASELQAAAKFRWWQVGSLVMGFIPVMISPVLTFAIYIAASHAESQPLDASRMFVSLSFLTIMSQPLSMLFQSGPRISSMVACFDRIGQFIDTKEWDGPRVDISAADACDEEKEKEKDIKITGGHFRWTQDAKPVLENVNVFFPQGKLTMVVGPVGSGKSTLLKGLLGEVPHTHGSISLPSRSIAFCDQTPWIANGTLKENITLFSGADEDYYESVLAACALNDDLAQIPGGDRSRVGSKGITLSGGQKQRLSLARALFSRRNFNVFDDILSGLDATTEMRVFAGVFGPDGLLRQRNTTAVLATHAVHLLPFADHIICIGPGGEIVEQGTFSDLRATEGYLRNLAIKPRPTLPEFTGTTKSVKGPDDKKTASTKGATTDPMDREKPRGVYRYYIRAIGQRMAVIYVTLATTYAFLYTFPYIWAKWWADTNGKDPGNRTAYYMGIYALLETLCLSVLVIFAWHAVITIVTTSGLRFHRALLTTALRAPLSFFEKTDTGVTLNRFSQDLQMVDSELPLAALNIACSGLIVVGQMLLIMNTSYWLALSFPGIIVVVWILQAVYLRTSRQLRHLDLETKSPLYSQFVESLDGLASIRAFGWQAQLKALLYERLDRSQRPFYLLLVVQQWLSLVLDCLAAGFVVLLIGIMVGLRNKVSPGFAGVALSNMIGLSGSMTTVVQVWTDMETSIASIQRIRDFERDAPSERNGIGATKVPQDWPSKGAIDIRNLVSTYKDGTVISLRNLTMNIKPGEKIGICGRTGSGKTSLALALFSMINIQEGSINIDGLDINSISPDDLRNGLNGIPQEPYFMSGTVRLNADPSGTRSDDEILRALGSVHLSRVIEAKGGLGAEMDDGMLSQGEKQLFCLARAIIKRGRIVVLDEATSNMDAETETLIQQVLEREFKDFTVITIAHRLGSILGSDRIAFLEAGELVEFDTPDALLGRESRFKALYNTHEGE